MSHQAPCASNAMLIESTAARAFSPLAKRSMCQNTGSFILGGSNFVSMILHPISPRRSGEFSTQSGSSWAHSCRLRKTREKAVTSRQRVNNTEENLLAGMDVDVI